MAAKSTKKGVEIASTVSSISKKIARGTLHKNYREIEVVRTDGSSFKIGSTYKSAVLRLDIDSRTHPAWTKEAGHVNARSSEVAKFNNKFAGLTFKL